MLPEAPKNKSPYEEAVEAFSFLKERLPETLQHPRVAVICGSGLGGLANTIHDEPRAELEYSSIPHFPCLTGKNEALKLNINLLISDLWSARACGKARLWTTCRPYPSCSHGGPCTVRAHNSFLRSLSLLKIVNVLSRMQLLWGPLNTSSDVSNSSF